MRSSEENKIAAEGSDRVRRQVFIPSNVNTNTFVFDTVSFLSLLTLVVFIVRVFNRVMESNNLQKVSIGADPSLSRSFQTICILSTEESIESFQLRWRYFCEI